MKIIYHNLKKMVLESIREDLKIVTRLGRKKGINIPNINIRLTALDAKKFSSGLPEHGLTKPVHEIPVSFHRRCKWEIGKQSFQIIKGNQSIWIIGGSSAGVYFGFNEVLTCLTGVIWAGVTEEDILFGPKRILPTGVQSPRFAYRCRDGSPPSEDISFEDFIKWLSRNRYNMKVFNSPSRERMTKNELNKLNRLLESRCMHQVVGYHAMNFWMPEETLKKKPAWQGMRNGKRSLKTYVELPECPNYRFKLSVQPCYSNKDVIEFITDHIANHVSDHPEIEIFSLWPHDGVNNWCQCPECVKKTPYEHMYNLAIKLLPKLPERVPVELIAYSNMLNLPFHKLDYSDRIIALFCPYLRHYHHRIYDVGGPNELITGNLYPEPDRINPVDDREYGELFRRWSPVWKKCGSTPGVFEYGGNFPDETRRFDFTRYLYNPLAKLRRDEAHWYELQGVKYFYLCSTYNSWPDCFHELNFARSMWNDHENLETLENSYYNAVAGKNGTEVRNALKRVSEKLHYEKSYEKGLDKLESILNKLPDSLIKQRYILWAEYIRLAKPARAYELSDHLEKAIKQEKQVQRFFNKHENDLKRHVPVNYLKKLSAIFEQRFKEKLKGNTETDYEL